MAEDNNFWKTQGEEREWREDLKESNRDPGKVPQGILTRAKGFCRYLPRINSKLYKLKQS